MCQHYIICGTLGFDSRISARTGRTGSADLREIMQVWLKQWGSVRNASSCRTYAYGVHVINAGYTYVHAPQDFAASVSAYSAHKIYSIAWPKDFTPDIPLLRTY